MAYQIKGLSLELLKTYNCDLKILADLCVQSEQPNLFCMPTSTDLRVWLRQREGLSETGFCQQ